MKMGNAYVPDCRMYSGSGGRSRNGIFRKYETFGADPHTALKKSCLTHGEKDAFFSFGEYLGYMDLEMQMRQLSLYENNLEAEILKRKAEVSGKKKLYQGIGILGGLLLAVLLV